jgi:hypothetical protein
MIWAERRELKMWSSRVLTGLCVYGVNSESGLSPYSTFVLVVPWCNGKHSGLYIQGSTLLFSFWKASFHYCLSGLMSYFLFPACRQVGFGPGYLRVALGLHVHCSPCEAPQEPSFRKWFLERLSPQGSFPYIPQEPTGLQHLTCTSKPGPQYLALEVQSQIQGTVTQQAPHMFRWLWSGMTVATRSQDPALSASHPTVALLSYFCTCRNKLNMN